MMRPNRGIRNKRKMAILGALDTEGSGSFSASGWVTPIELWKRHFVARTTLRNIYVGLKRYSRWNLVERSRSRSGCVSYRITAKGKERLKWLKYAN